LKGVVGGKAPCSAPSASIEEEEIVNENFIFDDSVE
jgi:hypothetical protein